MSCLRTETRCCRAGIDLSCLRRRASSVSSHWTPAKEHAGLGVFRFLSEYLKITLKQTTFSGNAFDLQ